ncbi:CHAT domain-containing protein [Halomicronema hongdechloris]|uniref:CHAT domain-containing protein n=1 Tax=Halomicronema hongdechloris TaxID=1209493 RepID=UPI00165181CE|nr:CHAT domain-containing protein [Halomicronema hongdechloris]
MTRSGTFSVRPNGDPSAAVRNAEDILTTTFLDWLGAGDTRSIERQLQTALLEVSQTSEEESSMPLGVNVFLACGDSRLQQLPWEAWARRLVPQGLPSNSIRVIRTARDDPQGLAGQPPPESLKKPRVLAIVAEDNHLDVDGDWEIIRGLRPVADVKKAKWLPEDAPHVITRKVFEAIADDRGWDVLFFTGHSSDQENTSGTFKLTPMVSLSVNDIREHLETAQRQGLRLAVFNSCSGLAIAQSLTRSGIQAIVMREKIHDDAAQEFLTQFCQRLREYQDAHTAMMQTCEVLRSAENIKFPSAHLVPSLFSPPRVLPYRIKSYVWRQQMRKWLPTKRELTTAGAVLLLGAVPVVQDVLVEVRVALQAVYRDITQQVPVMAEDAVPPVHLIAIDQRALDMAGITEAEPMPQAFIAELVDEVSLYQPKTIGIGYLLDDPDAGSSQLLDTMREVSREQGSWFVVPTSSDRNLEVFDELQQLEVSLRSDANFYTWDVDTPDDSDLEELCPFGYLMALSHSLNASPATANITSFRQKVDQAVGDQEIENVGNDFCKSVIALTNTVLAENEQSRSFIHQNKSFLGWQSIIDFSLPPSFFYQRTLASNLLEESSSDADTTAQSSDQVFIIGSGDYADAEDNYSPPLAIEYWWCLSLNRPNTQDSNQGTRQSCAYQPRSFSSSEFHAYMTSQLLQRHQVRVVPNYLMTGLAIFLGKGTVLALQKQPRAKRKKLIRTAFFAITGYGLLSLQLYVSVPVLLPVLFPLTVLLNYLGPITRRIF